MAPAARWRHGPWLVRRPIGYTLLAATAGSLAVSPQLYKDAGIDPVKDFAAVAMVSSAPLVVAINPSIPAHSVKELVAYAKANPGKLNYGAVIGTPPHMCGEMFKHITGANIVFVPYKTASQATIDVLAGQMNMTFEGTTAIVPHVKSGEVRALAVTTRRGLRKFPTCRPWTNSAIRACRRIPGRPSWRRPARRRTLSPRSTRS